MKPKIPFTRSGGSALLSITFCFLFASSCQPKQDHSGEVLRLDSIKNSLLETKAKLPAAASSDSITIGMLTGSIEEIKTHLVSDTVDRQTGILLAYLSNLKKHLTELIQYRKNKVLESDKSLERIENLQHDLKEGLIEDTKVQGYIVTETEALTKIIEELNLTTDMSRISAGKLDSLQPRITWITDSLKTK